MRETIVNIRTVDIRNSVVSQRPNRPCAKFSVSRKFSGSI